MVTTNPKVENPPSKIENLGNGVEDYVYLDEGAFDDRPDEHFTEHVAPSETDCLTPGVGWDHIQGLLLWSGYMLVTSDQTREGRAKMTAVDRQRMRVSGCNLGPRGYPHGGGGQAIGDLGVVAFETADNSESRIQTYQLLYPGKGWPLASRNFSLERPDKGAGAAAAAAIDDASKHLLAVTDNQDVDFYEVNDLHDKGSPHEQLRCTDTIRSGNNINLVVDYDGRVWLVNPWSEDRTTSFADYVDVYLVDIEDGGVRLVHEVQSHHITTNFPPYMARKTGVHCRYAAGVDLQKTDPPGRLWITARNFSTSWFYDPWLAVNHLDP